MRLKSSESGVVAACLEYLHARGIYAWRNNNKPVYDPTTKRFRRFVGLKGVSDILGIVQAGHYRTRGNPAKLQFWSGTFLAVECKAEGGHLSRDQASFLQKVSDMGCLAIVARSIDDLKEAGL